MEKIHSYITVAIITLCLCCSPALAAQKPEPKPTQPDAAAANLDQIIDKAIENENFLVKAMANYSPLVETYIQHLDKDTDLGAIPKNDRYFLGKLDMTKGVT